MAHSLDERLAIGEEIYKQKITKKEAMEKYGVGRSTIDNYIRTYKELLGVPVVRKSLPEGPSEMHPVSKKANGCTEIEQYMAMSKEELIKELILAKANELRAKKGYEVKGDGANKEFIPLNNKNSKS